MPETPPKSSVTGTDGLAAMPAAGGGLPSVTTDITPTGSGAPGPLSASVTLTTPQRRTLLGSMLASFFVLFVAYGSVVVVLLPQQVSLVDPANKVANLAAITATAAFVCLFVQPIIGALSDRTRSRLGRRATWILIGGIAGGVAIIGLQFSHALFWVGLLWVLADILLNTFQGPLSAVIADRVEAGSRGVASAFTGAGTAVGGTIGVVVAGRLLNHLGLAYWIFGAAMIVIALLFVVFNRDRSSKTLEVSRWSWREFGAGFWISPRKHPDYAWGFGGRFFMTLGYQAITAYQLYILTDYIKVPESQVGAVIGELSIASVITLVLGTIIFGKISDKIGRRKIFVFVASIVMVLGFLIPLISPTVPAMIVYSFVVGIGYGAYTAVDLALMIDVLPSKGNLGKDLGTLNIAANVPQAITPVAAALLLSLFGGNYASIFIYAIIAVLISSVLVWPIKSVR